MAESTTGPHEITAEDWSGYLRATARSLRKYGDPSYAGLNASELEQAADEMDRLRGLCESLMMERIAKEDADARIKSDLLNMASAFDLIPFNPNGDWRSIRELRVERRRTNPEAWAITNERTVLMRDGMWVLEPQPSSRDDDFLAQTRWSTAHEAIAFAREHMKQNPTGYTQAHRDLFGDASRLKEIPND